MPCDSAKVDETTRAPTVLVLFSTFVVLSSRGERECLGVMTSLVLHLFWYGLAASSTTMVRLQPYYIAVPVPPPLYRYIQAFSNYTDDDTSLAIPA